MNEWNSSRCVTEYYITLSLHMHGAGTHTHAGGGAAGTHACTRPAQRLRGGAGCSRWSPTLKSGSTTHIERGVPHACLCVPRREEARWNIHDV